MSKLSEALDRLGESESRNVKMVERLAGLELALEDVGWTRLWGEESDQEFTRTSLGKIAHLSRLMYLKNPLISQGVRVKRNYVWGQGVSIKATDPDVDKIIQQFLNDRKNKQEITGHQAQILKEADLECDGNIFLVFFLKGKTQVQVRSLPFVQIIKKINNPEDYKDTWYYQREWLDKTGSGHKELHPDWLYLPNKQPKKIDGITVRWDAPIYHIKIGGFSDWQFGVSEVYASIDWARAYKEFLEDWATITRAYARFAWKATVKGGSRAIAATKSKFHANDVGDMKAPPSTASFAILGDGAGLDPIRTAGATTSPNDGRRIMLMVASALGLPETFFGDVSVGSLATATSLDRPTELCMIDRQMLWSDVFTDMLNYVLLKAIEGKKLKGELNPEENTLPQIEWEDTDFDDQVQIRFPPIIEGDQAQNVKAIVDASMTGLVDSETLARLLLVALGEPDVEQALEQMQDDTQEAKEIWKKISEFVEKYHKK